ncbi:MAG: RQC domain-containing protein, partial [Bacteroidota bacterium]
NEKFGASHLINVLRGSNNQQINIYEHDQLPVYGKGSERSDKEWKAIFNQLIVHDYLLKDIDDYGVIKLNSKGHEFLEKPHDITLTEFQDFAKLNRNTAPVEDFKTYDTDLFEKLRKLRKKVADERSIPPYVIFQDPSLEDMASKYPLSIDEFQNITGVGRGKASKFAAPFIKLIKEYVEANNIERPTDIVVKSTARKSMNKLFIIQHVDRRTPLDKVANMKGMEFSELLGNIEQIVYSGTKLNLDYYIDSRLDEDTVDDIYDYFMGSETDDLGEAEKHLDSDIPLDEIRLVRIKFISEVAN